VPVALPDGDRELNLADERAAEVLRTGGLWLSPARTLEDEQFSDVVKDYLLRRVYDRLREAA
jgi:hypothetical protein